MTDKEIQASDEEMERFNVSQNEKCISAEEVKMIKAELNQLAAKDKYSNIYECTLRLINLYEEIILGNQMEIAELKKENKISEEIIIGEQQEINELKKKLDFFLTETVAGKEYRPKEELDEFEKENEELKKNALVWHKVTCFDKPDENGFITTDAPAYDNREYLVRTKRGHYSIQELMEVDSGVVFEDYEWEDVDAWAELSEV